MMKHREVRLVDRLVTPVAKQIQRTRPNVNALVVPHVINISTMVLTLKTTTKVTKSIAATDSDEMYRSL